jgi:Ca-activated chloride channel family protein
MLKEGPGKLAGDKYDEAKLKKELEGLPKGLSAEEAYNRLIYLLAEDYGPVVKEIENFKPAFDVGDLEGSGKASEEKGKKPDRVNVSILLDASGSMAGKVNGRVKMDLAKEAIRDFVSNLPEQSRVSLRVYGHKGRNSQKDKEVSCNSTEEVFVLGEYDESRFSKALGRFKPTGWTPLASAIQGAQQDLSAEKGENVKNVVYVVSDGIETCGGDPVKAAKALHESDIQAVVNIIGFDVDNAGQRALKKVAEAGGGEYQTARTGEDLRRLFEKNRNSIGNLFRTTGYRVGNLYEMNAYKLNMIDEIENLLGSNPFVGSKFLEVYDRENKRLMEAVNLLVSLEKIDEKNRDALREKIGHRLKLMQQYRDEKKEELHERLDQALEKARRQMEENIDEALNP